MQRINFSQFVATAACAIVALIAGAFVPACANADEIWEHLPEETLAVVQVDNLLAADVSLRAYFKEIDVAYGGVSALDALFPGFDRFGSGAFGVATFGGESVCPFALLPTADATQLIRSLGGDPDAKVSRSSIYSEKIRIHHRGNWVLLAIADDDSVANTGKLAERLQKQIEKQTNNTDDGTICVAIADDALTRLHELLVKDEFDEARLLRTRKRFAHQRRQWNSPRYWKECLAVYEPVIERLSEATAGAVFTLKFSPDVGVDVRATLLAEEVSTSEPAEELIPPTIDIEGQATYSSVYGPMPAPWSKLMTELSLAYMQSRTDQWEVEKFAEDDFDFVRSTLTDMVGQIKSFSTVSVLPEETLPPLANEASLVRVADVKQFVAVARQFTVHWNDLMENSNPGYDLVYDMTEINVGGRDGTRLLVDLPTAFRATNVPEVRDVLIDLFGNTGELRIDLFPLDDHHLLASRLPDELTAKLIAKLGAGPLASEKKTQNVIVKFHPAIYQDWSNRQYLVGLGGNVVGWKPKKFPTQERVAVKIVPSAGSLQATGTIAWDVVVGAAKLLTN